MPEHISFAHSGEPILSIDGAFLHSRYDPRLEAERYIESLSIRESNRVFIVIEPGFGYLCAAINKKWPQARILVAHCTILFKTPDLPDIGYNADAEWFPDESLSFIAFLERHIHDSEAGFVKIVDWKPSIRIFGDKVLTLVSEAAVFLKRSCANARTVGQFGEKWVRNAFRFVSRVKSELKISQGNQPIAVTASGPSLESGITALRKGQEISGIFIIAVSSSVPALLTGGVRPDIVVATDGGGWAGFHLHEAIRARIPIAAALTAELPSAAYESPILPICDFSRWQTIVARAGRIPNFAVPQRGTVAATAIDLALRLTNGPVYLSGYDLGVRDGRTHAKPNALDRFHEDTAFRLCPASTGAYGRYLSAKSGQSLQIYADWMAEHVGSFSSRIRVLGKASRAFDCLRHSDEIAPAFCGNALPRIEVRESIRQNAGEVQSRVFSMLFSGLNDEITEYKNNRHERSIITLESTLFGELLALLSPNDFSRAAALFKAEAFPLQEIQVLNEKIKDTLSACMIGAPNNG